jgi:hypothetical protein
MVLISKTPKKRSFKIATHIKCEKKTCGKAAHKTRWAIQSVASRRDCELMQRIDILFEAAWVDEYPNWMIRSIFCRMQIADTIVE